MGVAERGLEQEEEEKAPSRAVRSHLLNSKTDSSEYASCTSKLDVSAHPDLAATLPSTQATLSPGNGRTGQLHPPPAPARFNNLLDSCNADDSDTVKPKPRGPPLATVYQAAPHDVPHIEDDPPSPASTPISSPGDGSPTKDDFHRRYHGHSPLNGMSPPLGMFPGGEGQLQSYLFPISNSPMDLVTMLSRLASFTGELLLVLTPKIRKTSFERSKVCMYSGSLSLHLSLLWLI